MPKLEYSTEAYNVLNLFHGVDAMLFVEGNDDVPFWEFIIDKFADLSLKIKPVGGRPNLDKRLNEVLTGKLSAVIAIDLDLTFWDKEIEHPNILQTYGYSIENTLICGETIREVICSIGRISYREISIEECANWLREIEKTIKPLVVFDIENYTQGHGLPVVGDNCARFWKGKKSLHICDRKISTYLDNLTIEISEERFSEIDELLIKNHFKSCDIIRGHFLLSAVMQFVRITIQKAQRKISISNDSLFGALVLAFKIFFDEEHPHYMHYQNAILRVSVA